jgi:predicted TIM-barrel fold metal-dependent hydrolase
VNKWHRRLIAPGVKEKLAAMDGAGIELAAISTNDPGPEQFGKDGPAVARIVHDYLADTVKQHPKRFFALAALPLQDMDAALAELERCVSKLGMKGILLYSNIAGKFPDEPQFAPLFKRAEDMGVPVLLHPPYPVTFDATEGYNLTGGLGLMFDTTIALCRMILSGLLDRYPKLKLVCPHVGGTLPYLIGRIDHQVTVLKRVAVDIRKKPSEYLRGIYLDSVNALPAVIRFGYDFVGPDRMLYSSDHPWVDPKLILDNVNSLKLPAEDAEKLLSGNARRLFGL